MRFSTIVLIAGCMTAAPALAQNTAEPATNVDVNATAPATANEVTVATNESVAPPAETAAPAEATPAEPAPAPEKRGFPWGVLGLLGLIGLFGKRSRTG